MSKFDILKHGQAFIDNMRYQFEKGKMTYGFPTIRQREGRKKNFRRDLFQVKYEDKKSMHKVIKLRKRVLTCSPWRLDPFLRHQTTLTLSQQKEYHIHKDRVGNQVEKYHTHTNLSLIHI